MKSRRDSIKRRLRESHTFDSQESLRPLCRSNDLVDSPALEPARARTKLAVLVAIVLLAVLLPMVLGQDFSIPENPLRGRFVLEQKGCLSCHAIKGEGGNIGSDLGQTKFYGSFLELASIMWNHSPEMARRMRELDLRYPKFSRQEITELIAYLYYLRYLGEPGDLYRGRMLVREKGCLTCHSVGGKGGDSAPAFDQLAK
ncbi:MAG TPA: hypothetical protein VMY18_11890, partial [Acidobacteriota bacterium]|nr:hypothetical protein [Acidobacteriota bacterium]